MNEKPTNPLTPDRPYWYDQMIAKGFAERDESYFSIYFNGNPSEIFKQTLLAAGGEKAQLLDIGCGPGKYTEMFTSGYNKIVGLDLSVNSISYGQIHHKTSNLEFVVGDSRELPFEDECFDVVASRLSPHSLSEMMRVLRPGGQAFAMRVGETDALTLRKLFGQKDLVKKMEGYIARGEPHSLHISDQWREVGFLDVHRTEYEYDMHFESVIDLAKYLSRIPIIPEFDMKNIEHMQKLNDYSQQNIHPETGAIILHRHRNIIKGVKAK